MINGLHAFIAERNLLQTCPIIALKDTRIGIDLDVYLHSLLTHPDTYEPFVAALGGVPLALLSHIESDLRNLELKRIKPVFVLSGLPPVRKARPFQLYDPKTRLRALAWEAYEEGDVERMQDLLTRSGSLDTSDITRAVLRKFKARSVEWITAPYLASGQLVSLERHPRGYVHALWGSTSLFLYHRVDRVIQSMNLAAGTFSYVSKASLMSELGVRNEDEFLDAGILAGWEHGSTFPPLADGSLGPLPEGATAAAAAASQGKDGAGPPLSPEHKPVNLRLLVEALRQYRGGAGLCLAFSEHPEVKSRQYIDQFFKSKSIIKFSMVVRAEDGAVLPLPLASSPTMSVPTPTTTNGVITPSGPPPNGIPSPSDIPSELDQVFSARLPDELFLHLSRGLISQHVHAWLTTGYIIEKPPLDNGETTEYRHFVRDALTEQPQSPNCVAIALACSALHPAWSFRRLSVVYWWAPHTERVIPHDSKITQQLISRVKQWNVPLHIVYEELGRQVSSTIDIAMCLAATGTNELANRTKTPRRQASQSQQQNPNHQSGALEKKDEIVANVIWRMLELRGFLNHDHLHTPYARALHLGLREAKVNDKLQESLYLAFELIRAGALHANFYTWPTNVPNPTKNKGNESSSSASSSSQVVGVAGEPHIFSGGPSYGETDEEKSYLLLIMRALSLLPMQYKPEPWTAPVSRELLVFNSFVKAMGRSLRNLVEIIASTMLLCGDARRARDDYLEIALSLPFQSDTNTGLGVVIKCYIEAFLAFHGRTPTESEVIADDAEVKESKENVLSMLEGTFANVRDLRYELQRGFRFWNSLLIGVRELVEKQEVSKELAQHFEGADKWFRLFSV